MSTESSGSDCSRVCVHVRVCMCSHARVHICVCDYCQKRKIPPLVQGGKPTKSQNPKESAIVLNTGVTKPEENQPRNWLPWAT